MEAVSTLVPGKGGDAHAAEAAACPVDGPSDAAGGALALVGVAAEEVSLYVLIPVFNEAENIPVLLAGLRDASPRLIGEVSGACVKVLLLDDGSTDGTFLAAREWPRGGGLDVVVLRSEENRGPGDAFRRGFCHLAGVLRPSDLVMTLEGDNTSSLQTAVRLLRRRREGYDAVLASPYAYSGGFGQTTLLRRVISHIANGFVRSALGIRGIHTMSCFFRVTTGACLLRLQSIFGPGIVESRGFESMVEMLIKLALTDASISEVETKVDWSLRRGKSKMKMLRTIRGYLSLATKVRRWQRMAGAVRAGQ